MARFRARGFSLVVLTAGALATAPTAFGHGPFVPAKGYVSSVTSIQPNVLGLQASVVGDQLVVRNWSLKTVIILDPDGRPYLLFGRRGVFANQGFGWKRVSAGTSFTWHDPRVRWSGRQPPEAVRRHPDRAHLLRDWSVRGSVAGKPFVIRGLLGYAPPPGAGRDSGSWTTWLAVALAGAAAAAGIGFLGVRSRSRPVRAGSGSSSSTETGRAPGSRFRRRPRSSPRS